jgi:Diacylglycerol kinase accessory domain
VRNKDTGELEEILVPNNVKALVVLNLQSYGGGCDLFGLAADAAHLARKGFSSPTFNDGQFEVGLLVGFNDGQFEEVASSISWDLLYNVVQGWQD